MTANEKRLAKAAKDYPKGTKFYSASNGVPYVSSGVFRLHFAYKRTIINEPEGCIYSEKRKRWAKKVNP